MVELKVVQNTAEPQQKAEKPTSEPSLTDRRIKSELAQERAKTIAKRANLHAKAPRTHGEGPPARARSEGRTLEDASFQAPVGDLLDALCRANTSQGSAR